MTPSLSPDAQAGNKDGTMSQMTRAQQAAVIAIDGAREIADDLLFPAAMGVDAAASIPAAHLDRLAEIGLYGLAGPVADGGLGADAAVVNAVLEILASGCLATTFVWLQHHRAVRAVAVAPDDALRRRWLGPLCRGTSRAGIALGGVLPGPPLLSAAPVPGGYLLDGTSPWVTGWGLIDTLYTAARAPNGSLITALVPVREDPSLSAEPLRLVAVNASRTVQLRFERHFVPGDHIVEIIPFAEWAARDLRGLRGNGSLALGVAARCCALTGVSPLDDELSRQRAALDAASPQTMPAARAQAAEFVMRAAAALVAITGSRAILAGEHPQRLAREALFLLVFASRPAIKEHLAGLLTAPARPSA
jgi:alkylation response protein AidB-like acyl-CoA dehydrogenase